MQGNWESRKTAKGDIILESKAAYVKKLEAVIADYTDEEQKVWLLCYNPLSGQKINFRIHTTHKGIVTKVEREKKIKGKIVWEELKLPVTK